MVPAITEAELDSLRNALAAAEQAREASEVAALEGEERLRADMLDEQEDMARQVRAKTRPICCCLQLQTKEGVGFSS